MIGQQRPDIGLAGQHVVDKAFESALGADLDKHAHAFGVHSISRPLTHCTGEAI